MIYYDYYRSSAAYRCRIAFNLLGVTPEVRSVHLAKGEQSSDAYAAINPQKLVPALDVDGVILTQSLAIIQYLNETEEGQLLGISAIERAQIRSFADIIACDIHPLQNLRVLQYIEREYGQSEQTQKDKWCQKWLGDGLSACEVIAQKHRAGSFVFGNNPTLADIFLIPQLFSAQRFNVDLKAMPRLIEIYNHCQTLPEFINAAPYNQPDAPPSA